MIHRQQCLRIEMARFRFEPDDGELQSLYASGLTADALATRYGVSKKTILRHLERLGVQRRTLRKVTPEVESRIVELARQGMSVKQAEKELGLEATVIREYAARNGERFKDSYHAGFITTGNGYRMVPAPDHPGKDSKGYVREHVLVAEKVLGRYLLAHEIAHHRDRNKANNAPGNIEVMTLSEHARLHASAGDTGWAKYHSNRKI